MNTAFLTLGPGPWWGISKLWHRVLFSDEAVMGWSGVRQAPLTSYTFICVLRPTLSIPSRLLSFVS